MNAKNEITRVCVYWSSEDKRTKCDLPERWMYEVTFADGTEESGEYNYHMPEKTDNSDLCGAVVAVAYDFGLSIESGDVAVLDSLCAVWEVPGDE